MSFRYYAFAALFSASLSGPLAAQETQDQTARALLVEAIRAFQSAGQSEDLDEQLDLLTASSNTLATIEREYATTDIGIELIFGEIFGEFDPDVVEIALAEVTEAVQAERAEATKNNWDCQLPRSPQNRHAQPILPADTIQACLDAGIDLTQQVDAEYATFDMPAWYYIASDVGTAEALKLIVEVVPSDQLEIQENGIGSLVNLFAMRSASNGNAAPEIETVAIAANAQEANWLAPGAAPSDFVLMQLAGRPKSAEIAEILLDAGGDPAFADEKGLTALHYALRKEDWDLASLLIDRGAPPSALEEGGFSPLRMALRMDAPIWIFEKLIAADANLFETSRGFNLLHRAAKSSTPEIASLLIDAGVEPGAKNRNGETPIDIASENPDFAGSGVLGQ